MYYYIESGTQRKEVDDIENKRAENMKIWESDWNFHSLNHKMSQK